MNTARWYPRSLPDKVVWHANFDEQAAEDGATYGLTPDDLKQIHADRLTVQFLAEKNEYLEAELENWREMRDAFLNGDIGSTPPALPQFNVGSLPADALTGIGDRAERYADQIKISGNYTEGVGAAYKIIAPPGQDVPEDEMKPVFKAEALPNWKVRLRVALKGMSGVRVLMQRGNDSNDWINVGNFPDGEIIDDTPPAVPNQAETRRYKMIFLRKNEPVGEYSDIIEITIHA